MKKHVLIKLEIIVKHSLKLKHENKSGYLQVPIIQTEKYRVDFKLQSDFSATN